MKIYKDFFWKRYGALEASGVRTRGATRGPHGPGGAALGGRVPPRMCGAPWSIRLCVYFHRHKFPINTKTLVNREPMKNFITAAELLFFPNLIWRPVPVSSAGGGNLLEAVFINLAASMIMCE